MFKQFLTEQNLKGKLMQAFKIGGICTKYKDGGGETVYVYPKIHHAKQKGKDVQYIFTLPHGLNPEEVHKKKYVFQQVFGDFVEIEGGFKEFRLNAYAGAVSLSFPYRYNDIKDRLTGHEIPIYCGYDKKGNPVIFDLKRNPHMIPAGETGSGKSSFLRVVLCTLIQYANPDELRLVLGDMKRSEFGMFRNVAHVDAVHMNAKDLLSEAKRLRGELDRRGLLFDEHEALDIDEYNEMFPDKKEPHIIFAIDEVFMLKKETELLHILEEISAIGRALGIFLILSMQRPDSKLLDGALKNNMTVRAGFHCSDDINSRVIGVDGCENLPEPGRMILKTNTIQEVQCPLLDGKEAKNILKRYKVAQSFPKQQPKPTETPQESEITTWDDES